MFRLSLSRGVSAGALILTVSSELALAQQSLPTIDIGGARRTAAAARTPQRGTSVAAAAGPTAPAAPVDTSRLRLEPKTPTEAYIVRNADSATKMDVPIKEIPASIEVVPKQVLIDQQATNLTQAVDNVSACARIISTGSRLRSICGVSEQTSSTETLWRCRNSTAARR